MSPVGIAALIGLALALPALAVVLVGRRRTAAKAEIGDTLQRELKPPPLPDIPGWATAAFYSPAGAENEVGGDFYDVFEFEGGWLLVVGDVTGKGADAAAITAQARYTLRTAAGLTGDPVAALAALNEALLERDDAALCTVAALALSEDPAQPVRVAVAGHPPPLLVEGDRVAEVAGLGPVLGAFADAEWEIESLAVTPGQELVLITDGVVEARGAGGRFGEERLHGLLAGAAGPGTAVRRLESALSSFAAGGLEDDATALAVAPVAGQVSGTLPGGRGRSSKIGPDD